jgi:hypothetical protein
VASLGTFALSLAWFWYGFAFFDEMTEECKAATAGTTSAGLGAFVGGVPLALVYFVVLLALILIGLTRHSPRRYGALLAVLVIMGASAIGICAGQLLWDGALFAMSAENAACNQFSP